MWIKRALAAIGLLYIVLMAFSSLSWLVIPESLYRPARWVRTFLNQSTLVPGVALFYVPYQSHRDVISDCFEVYGTALGESESHRLYRTGTYCEPPQVLKPQLEELTWIRYLYEAYAFFELGSHSPEPTLNTLKSQQMLSAAGFYVCSTQTESLGQVELRWTQKLQDVRTGETLTQERLKALWSCSSSELQEVAWKLGFEDE